MKPVKLFHHPLCLPDIFIKTSNNTNVDIIFNTSDFIYLPTSERKQKTWLKNYN